MKHFLNKLEWTKIINEGTEFYDRCIRKDIEAQTVNRIKTK